MRYFNRQTREENIALLAAELHFEDWLEKEKVLTAEERRWVKTGCTYFRKAGSSLVERGSDDYKRAILNQSRVCSLILENEGPRIDGEKYMDSLRITKDDLYDLYEAAMARCERCKKAKEFEKCSLYSLLMRLGAEGVVGETDGCPYRMR